MVNCHHGLWQRRSHILAPLTSPVGGKGNTSKWTKEQQNAFKETKRVISKETPLAFPDHAKPFHVCTDASDCQMGAVIMQEGKSLAFHSRKMNAAQKQHTTGEQELLSIAEALKEFRTLLFGQQVTVCADHENILHGDSANNRIACWQPLIEEHQTEIHHVAGKDNAAADALSRMEANFCASQKDSIATAEKEQDGLICACTLAQLTQDEGAVTPAANNTEPAFAFALEDDADTEKFPVLPQPIAKEQQKCCKVRHCAEKSSQEIREWRAEGVQLLTHNQQIIAPQSLQQRIAAWCHVRLRHPGHGQMLKTLQQVHWWETMQNDVRRHVCACQKCQLCKTVRKKHGSLPAEEAEDAVPWKRVNVDSTGPWTVKATNGAFQSQALIAADPATGWFEVAKVRDAAASTVSEAFDHEWLSRCPRPQCIGFDGGGEHNNAFKEVAGDCGLAKAQTTTHNPQSNDTAERVHLVPVNALKTHKLKERELGPQATFEEMLTSAAFATRSAHHATSEATLAQLVFGRDMLLPITMEANWANICQWRQEVTACNNAKENNSCIPHKHKARGKVLCNKHGTLCKLSAPRTGPCEARQVHSNSALHIQRGAVSKRINV